MSTPLHVVPTFEIPEDAAKAIQEVHDQRDTARFLAVALEGENDALLRLIVEVADEAEVMGRELPECAYLARRLRAGVAEIQAVSA